MPPRSPKHGVFRVNNSLSNRLEAYAKIATNLGVDAVALVPGPNFTRAVDHVFMSHERPFLMIIPATGTPAALVPNLELRSWDLVGFDGPVFLASQQTDVKLRKLEIGMGELTLRPSEADPWADLGDPMLMMAFQLESDNTMQPGRILTEVPGEDFLPYYFKMTDFSAGAPAEANEGGMR